MNPNMPEPQEQVEFLENPEFFFKDMTEAGFKDVAIHASDYGMTIDSIETFRDDMVKGSAPLVMMKKNMTEEVWQEKTKLPLTI
jgi:hypothetical protein